MEPVMREKLLALEEEYDRLSDRMSSQDVASDPEAYRSHAQAQAQIAETVSLFRQYKDAEQRLQDARAMLREETDADMRELATAEVEELEPQLEAREQDLKLHLLPKDPNDSKNTIVEIRAGTGGEEAALFAADLYRAYSRYAEHKGWKVEVLNSHETGMGGFKEIVFKVSGEGVYRELKYEGGGHRVQRVPATETQGRIHTSAVTVAVLPEAEEVDFEIDPNDLQVDVYRSSGPGGQSVNTTDSAVRITHKPSGMVVTCQDEKSQHKNKARAIMILRARLLAQKQQEEAAKRAADRRNQVGSGDRSERIRTYNFPQSRVTDHRINLTVYKLDQVMAGEFQEIIDALITADREAMLAEQASV